MSGVVKFAEILRTCEQLPPKHLVVRSGCEHSHYRAANNIFRKEYTNFGGIPEKYLQKKKKKKLKIYFPTRSELTTSSFPGVHSQGGCARHEFEVKTWSCATYSACFNFPPHNMFCSQTLHLPWLRAWVDNNNSRWKNLCTSPYLNFCKERPAERHT